MEIDYIKLHIKSKLRKESEMIDFIKNNNLGGLILINEPTIGWCVNNLKLSLIAFDCFYDKDYDGAHTEDVLQAIENISLNIYDQIGVDYAKLLYDNEMRLSYNLNKLTESINNGHQK